MRTTTKPCSLCGMKTPADTESPSDHILCIRCAVSAARMIYQDGHNQIRDAWVMLDPSFGTEGDILPLPVRLRAHPYFRGRGVVICIMDSDFVLHPDIADRVLCYVDASQAQIREDVAPPPAYGGSWHGTMTAVVAAGDGGLSGGRYRGMAPEAKLVLVRVSDQDGRIRERDILRGLRWLLRRGSHYGVRIVNLSLGGDDSLPSGLSEVDRAVEELVANGVAVVAASGNSGARALTPPASAPSVITVGGLDDSGGKGQRKLWSSNYGPTRDGILKPDLIAPSLLVPAPIVPDTEVAREAKLLAEFSIQNAQTWLAQYRAAGFGDDSFSRLPIEEAVRRRKLSQKLLDAHYQHVDGTSFAAPAVSGTLAQMFEANPALAPREAKKLLRQTAEFLEGLSAEVQGRGVLQPGRAVLAALRVARPLEPVRSPEVFDTHLRFSICDPQRFVEEVDLCCSAYQWEPRRMIEERPGFFSIQIPKPQPGEYVYKFRLNGKLWRDDANNEARKDDGLGGWNSVIRIV